METLRFFPPDLRVFFEELAIPAEYAPVR